MAQHGLRLPPGTVRLIADRVEGWAAGLRLAALSLDGHPDPEVFIKNLAAEDNALTSYLVDEVLDAQPPAGRELMLRTSILDRVSAELALELTGDERAGSTLAALARSGALVQPLGHGWYRYHSMFADVLRLKLLREFPDLTPGLHRKAAGWYQRNGQLGRAVAHAEQVNDWQLAARITVDELATGQLLNPRAGSPVAGILRRMRAPGRPDAPAQPQSLLASTALDHSDGRDQAAGTLLAAAEELLGRLPADQEIPSRLAAAMLRFAASRRSGDLDAARIAITRAETLFRQLPPGLRSRHQAAYADVLAGRGSVEFWSGNPAAAVTAFTQAAAAATAGSRERAAFHGDLALIEALRGQLARAAELARAGISQPEDSRAGPARPAAAVALALVHLEHNELQACRSQLKQAEAVLQAHPDRLINAVACLVAARSAVAQAHGPAATDLIRCARDGWSPPPWLDHLLTVAEAQAATAAGDIRSAFDAARRARAGSALDAAVAQARAFLAAGDLDAARAALPREALPRGACAPAGEPDERLRLDAYLASALLSYRSGDSAQGRRSLERALRLGKPEHLRLPFAMNRAWIQPALRHCPGLAAEHRDLLQPGPGQRGGIPARPARATRLDPVVVEPLSDREREVLNFASSMLSTEEIARAMYLSVNTVKTHFKSIFRKLGATRRGEAVRRAKKLGLI